MYELENYFKWMRGDDYRRQKHFVVSISFEELSGKNAQFMQI